MINIYGSPRSSAGRCYLVMEEVGAPYTEVPLEMMDKKEHKELRFLKLNPNGKVPCLVDDGAVIWESLAINAYLADKYKPALLGSTPEQRALVLQWSIWAVLELQVPMVDILIQTFFVPEAKRDAGVIAKAKEKLPVLLKILDDALADREYILGREVSLADLNLASVVNITTGLNLPIADFKNIGAWFARMKERPSFKKFAALRTRPAAHG